jgi:hypothetical protein
MNALAIWKRGNDGRGVVENDVCLYVKKFFLTVSFAGGEGR